MDEAKFISHIHDPRRSEQDLLQTRTNAINKGEIEFARMVEDVLHERFPTWNSVVSRRGGSDPTIVRFRDKSKHLDSQREAYVWMLNEFMNAYPILSRDKTLEVYFRDESKFSKSLERLFRNSATFNGDKSKYQSLQNGWYAKLVLSNDEKLQTLMYLSTIAEIPKSEWDWDPLSGKGHRDVPDVKI